MVFHGTRWYVHITMEHYPCKKFQRQAMQEFSSGYISFMKNQESYSSQ